jgi:hypothetical protein
LLTIRTPLSPFSLLQDFPAKEHYYPHRNKAISEVEGGPEANLHEIGHEAVAEAVNDVRERAADDEAKANTMAPRMLRAICKSHNEEKSSSNKKGLKKRMQRNTERNARVPYNFKTNDIAKNGETFYE